MEKNKIFVVGGLLFGDEGKGTTVEYLVKKTNSHLVVRYNGGPQAAHHIVLADKRWHCFSHFGSGSFFKNCHTLMSKYMVIYPHTMLREAEVLIQKGVEDIWSKTYLDFECFIITPYHQLLNRVSELLRGKTKHGSTGMGVGVCIDEAINAYPRFFPKGEFLSEKTEQTYTCLQVKDLLLDYDFLFEKVKKIIKEKIQQVKKLIENFKLNNPNDKDLIEEANKLCYKCIADHNYTKLSDFYTNFTKNYSKSFVYSGDILIKYFVTNKEHVIFEGAQGALLDRVYGMYPHLTKSLCSDDNAIALIKEIESNANVKVDFIKIGVLRAYSSRHGNGPFVSCDPDLSEILKEDHNMNTKWQGEFRVGPFDLVAARYGVEIFKPDCLSITCLDRFIKAIEEKKELRSNPVCTRYFIKKKDITEDIKTVLSKGLFEYESSDEGVYIKRINKVSQENVYKSLDLRDVCHNAVALMEGSSRSQMITEHIDHLDVNAFLDLIQKSLECEISIISNGPTNEDKMIVNSKIFM